MFDETDEYVEYYFDFDDVEGIDLDDEDSRYRRVLRFKDCYNFEIEIDSGAAGGVGGVGAPGAPAGGGGGGISRVATENTFLPVLGSEKVVESGRIVTVYCVANSFLGLGF